MSFDDLSNMLITCQDAHHSTRISVFLCVVMEVFSPGSSDDWNDTFVVAAGEGGETPPPCSESGDDWNGGCDMGESAGAEQHIVSLGLCDGGVLPLRSRGKSFQWRSSAWLAQPKRTDLQNYNCQQ